MTSYPAGLVMSGSEGCVHVRIWDERFYLCSEDLGALLFLGESVPLLRPGSPFDTSPRGGGLAHLNRSGRAVIFEVGNQCYLIPRDRFLMVALGEEVSCPVADIVTDGTSPLSTTTTTGGATP